MLNLSIEGPLTEDPYVILNDVRLISCESVVMFNDKIVSTATMAFPKAKILLQKIADSEGDEELADAVSLKDQTVQPVEANTHRSEL